MLPAEIGSKKIPQSWRNEGLTKSQMNFLPQLEDARIETNAFYLGQNFSSPFRNVRSGFYCSIKPQPRLCNGDFPIKRLSVTSAHRTISSGFVCNVFQKLKRSFIFVPTQDKRTSECQCQKLREYFHQFSFVVQRSRD